MPPLFCSSSISVPLYVSLCLPVRLHGSVRISKGVYGTYNPFVILKTILAGCLDSRVNIIGLHASAAINALHERARVTCGLVTFQLCQDQTYKTKTKAARARARPRPIWDRSCHKSALSVRPQHWPSSPKLIDIHCEKGRAGKWPRKNT